MTKDEIKNAINKKIDQIDGRIMLDARMKAKKLRKINNEIDREINIIK